MDFTGALSEFGKKEHWDDEAWYYRGMTCEKLNLFDQAIESYKKIKSPDFASLALQRLNTIEKRINLAPIKDISPEIYSIIVNSPRQ